MILCMGAASAADVSSEPAANYTADVPLGASEETGGADTIIGSSSEGDDVLGDESTGSFAELEEYINENKGYEKVVYLNKDYAFNNETDGIYNESGIYIKTFTIIDGQNHTISTESDVGHIFSIYGESVILKNIIFKSPNSDWSSILLKASSNTLDNISFINCMYPLKIDADSSNTIISNCNFENGGHISVSGKNSNIYNSVFKNNTDDEGGCIYINGDSCHIDNVEFINNTGKYGGAIYLDYTSTSNKLYITGSTFKKNSANYGGAIYNNCWWFNPDSEVYQYVYNNVILDSCKFSENSAISHYNIFGTYEGDSQLNTGSYFDEIDAYFEDIEKGEVTLPTNNYEITHGPIEIQVTGNLIIDGQGSTINANGNQVFEFRVHCGSKPNIYLKNITINNAWTSGNGAVINLDARVNFYVQYCSFNNNSADGNGGVIYANSQGGRCDLFILNSNFTNNNALAGGSIYGTNNANGGGINQLKNSRFENNSANTTGGAIWNGKGIHNNNNVVNNYFINNTANNYGAIYSPNRVFNSNTCYYINNSAYVEPRGHVTSTSDENNYLLSDFINFFTGTDVKIPFNNYYFPSTVELYDNTVVDGSGSTIDANGAMLFNVKGNNVTIKNLKIYNGTINIYSEYGDFSIINVTFINCTGNTLNVQGGTRGNIITGLIEDTKFINCTKSIISPTSHLTVKNTYIDDVCYNDNLMLNFESNNVYTLYESDYYIFSPFILANLENVTINGAGSTFTLLSSNPLFYLNSYCNNITFINFKILNSSADYAFNANFADSATIGNKINFINIDSVNAGINVYGHNEIDGNEPSVIIANSSFTNSSVKINKMCNITNSTFTNGSHLNLNAISTVEYSKFINCSGTNGGAIYFYMGGDIVNSTFINCNGEDGGALYLAYNYVPTYNITNSTFNGNSAIRGGAIYAQGKLVNVSDSKFENNSAILSAGDIFFNKENGYIKNSVFNGGSADIGGSIIANCPVTIINSTFENTTAMKGGSAVFHDDDSIVENCTFTNNSAIIASSVYIDSNNITLTGSTFNDNAADIGGIIVSEGDNTELSNCSFENNLSPVSSAIVLNGNNSELSSINFTDNIGDAITINGDNAIITDSIISDNNGTAIFVNGNNAKVSGSNITNNKADAIIINGDNAVLSENNVLDNEGYGVIFNGTDPTVENITVVRNYPANIYVTQNSNYDPATHKDRGNDFGGDEEIITWKDSLLTVIVDNIYEGNPAIVNITLTDSLGNPFDAIVYVKINNTNVPIMVINGTGIGEVYDLTSGSYDVTANYTGTITDHYAVTNTTSFTVTAKDNVSINVSDVIINVGENATVNVNITEVNGQNITITVNGKKEEVTVENGAASADFADLAVGEYDIIVEYAGDETYNANSANATLTVNKINTDLTNMKLKSKNP